jgi:hypothetical protein
MILRRACQSDKKVKQNLLQPISLFKNDQLNKPHQNGAGVLQSILLRCLTTDTITAAVYTPIIFIN